MYSPLFPFLVLLLLLFFFFYQDPTKSPLPWAIKGGPYSWLIFKFSENVIYQSCEHLVKPNISRRVKLNGKKEYTRFAPKPHDIILEKDSSIISQEHFFWGSVYSCIISQELKYWYWEFQQAFDLPDSKEDLYLSREIFLQ